MFGVSTVCGQLTSPLQGSVQQKTKVGQEQYHSLGIGLRLWRWAVLSFCNSPPSCIGFISVQDCPINRPILEKQVKQNKRHSTNIRDAICNPQLNPVFQAKRGAFTVPMAKPGEFVEPIMIIHGFFFNWNEFCITQLVLLQYCSTVIIFFIAPVSCIPPKSISSHYCPPKKLGVAI